MNEADIPIDIHTLKLQDWLVSRRIVPKNIQPYIKDIRTKISNAIQDMPSNEQLIKLLSGAHINYFHCKEIVEILKQTEKDTKSVFGYYGSQRMKDWQEILKLYEKENVYLAEAAQIYVRNINFEIPGVKKHITRLEQQSDEALKRSQDLKKQEHQHEVDRVAYLAQFDLKGDNLREELTAALTKLPEIYAKSIKDIGVLKDAAEYYRSFTENLTDVPIIRHIIEFGNTTVYQYINKEAPIKIEENPVIFNLVDEEEPNTTTNNDEIDFGLDDNDNGDSSTISAEIIDFGDVSADTPGDSGADIDWGIESAPTEPAEIDFDVPIEEYGIVVEGVGMDGGIAKGDQAYTILDSPNHRELFIDELYELQSFLKMRIYELNHLDMASSLLFSMSDNDSMQDIGSITKMLNQLNAVLAEVENPNTRHYFQLKHSNSYVEILHGKLKQMKRSINKIRDTIVASKVRSEQLKKQSAELEPVLEDLIKQTKILQGQIEKDISKRYKNRVVNLMGGLNAI